LSSWFPSALKLAHQLPLAFHPSCELAFTPSLSLSASLITSKLTDSSASASSWPLVFPATSVVDSIETMNQLASPPPSPKGQPRSLPQEKKENLKSSEPKDKKKKSSSSSLEEETCSCFPFSPQLDLPAFHLSLSTPSLTPGPFTLLHPSPPLYRFQSSLSPSAKPSLTPLQKHTQEVERRNRAREEKELLRYVDELMKRIPQEMEDSFAEEWRLLEESERNYKIQMGLYD